jgi:plasmid stability protein
MADLHIKDIDEQIMMRLQRRAKEENRSVEALIRETLHEAASIHPSSEATAEEMFVRAVERIRRVPAKERIPDIEPVEVEGLSASELLIRDRRRR